MKEKKNKNEINAGMLKDKEEKEKRLVEEGLAEEISKKYKIEKKEALKLIKSTTLESLDSLKSEIEKNSPDGEKLGEKELEDLFLTLKGAKEVIENLSKLEIVMLKDRIEDEEDEKIDISKFKNKLETVLPEKMVYKAKNPDKLHEHILGFALGSANSIVAVVDALYQIGAGIIKTPYHLYLVISGKGEIEGIDEV